MNKICALCFRIRSFFGPQPPGSFCGSSVAMRCHNNIDHVISDQNDGLELSRYFLGVWNADFSVFYFIFVVVYGMQSTLLAGRTLSISRETYEDQVGSIQV